ncbi:MAG: sigma-70 family RNA polymerase sigma factor [Eubacteriales bacterium]|jgi:RNA polymerase sporulation-specific sigma factor
MIKDVHAPVDEYYISENKPMPEAEMAEEQNVYAQNRELIERAQKGDEEAAAKLVELNGGLVRSIAIRFRDRGTEIEDLIQIGMIGMIKAVHSFDTSRGTAFSTYAVPLIIGEIRRHLRDAGIIKVSRSYKKLGMTLMRERSRILSDKGREPHISELASACGVSPEDAAVALDAMTPVSSLSDAVFGDDGMLLENTIADDENDIERLSDNIALSQSISKMQPLWRRIVLLRYYRNLTQQQTADCLGLSQVKVSREEKKILDFLRSEMIN